MKPHLMMMGLFSIFLFSCNALSDGKIIKRGACYKMSDKFPDAKGQYLVNTSAHTRITFTLKVTSEISYGPGDGYKNESYTKTYTLNPGEEESLLCDEYEYMKGYEKYSYEIVGALNEK